MSKIFGVGLHRTATGTLSKCLEWLGYKTRGYTDYLLEDLFLHRGFKGVTKVVDKFDALLDWPWPLIYKEMDERYAGSKFILTMRKKPETWLDSVKKQSLKTVPFLKARKIVYGFYYPHFHEQAYLDYYHEHNQKVMDYFKGRENDFLVMNFEAGDGWEKLCSFLNKEIPEKPIPQVNRDEWQKAPLNHRILNRFLMLFP